MVNHGYNKTVHATELTSQRSHLVTLALYVGTQLLALRPEELKCAKSKFGDDKVIRLRYLPHHLGMLDYDLEVSLHRKRTNTAIYEQSFTRPSQTIGSLATSH